MLLSLCLTQLHQMSRPALTRRKITVAFPSKATIALLTRRFHPIPRQRFSHRLLSQDISRITAERLHLHPDSSWLLQFSGLVRRRRPRWTTVDISRLWSHRLFDLHKTFGITLKLATGLESNVAVLRKRLLVCVLRHMIVLPRAGHGTGTTRPHHPLFAVAAIMTVPPVGCLLHL